MHAQPTYLTSVANAVCKTHKVCNCQTHYSVQCLWLLPTYLPCNCYLNMSDNKQGRIECNKFSVDQKHHQRRFMLGVFAKAWFCQVRHAWLCLSAQFLVNTVRSIRLGDMQFGQQKFQWNLDPSISRHLNGHCI